MGKMLIGGEAVLGTNGKIQGFNPAANEPFGPEFGGATKADLTRACALAGEAFNFSTGKPLNVIEVVDAIRAAMKSNLAPVILNEASNEIREQHLDSSKAHSVLKWRAKFGLEQGLPLTIEWYRQYLNART